MIKTKSIYYDKKEPDNGTRTLVMRRWPRGISKDQIDEWRKDLGPSSELLKQWNEGEIAFAEFRERYLAEMQDKIKEVQELARRARTETITLLCHEKSEDHCHRKMLKELIEQSIANCVEALTSEKEMNHEGIRDRNCAQGRSDDRGQGTESSRGTNEPRFLVSCMA